jgi:hypothetical protein
MRAIASVPPPGGNGTISRTNRVGHACARALRGSQDGTDADAAASATRRRRLSMVIPGEMRPVKPKRRVGNRAMHCLSAWANRSGATPLPP